MVINLVHHSTWEPYEYIYEFGEGYELAEDEMTFMTSNNQGIHMWVFHELTYILYNYSQQTESEFAEADSMNYTINEERLTANEYIEFLKNTDLGSQYPQERFEERITILVNKVSISLVARNQNKEIIGVCFGITDFAYWLFITDLGVVRECVGQGIGTALVRKLHELAGGTENIIMYTCVNENAIPFYEKIGMTHPSDVMVYNHIEWTDFTVE